MRWVVVLLVAGCVGPTVDFGCAQGRAIQVEVVDGLDDFPIEGAFVTAVADSAGSGCTLAQGVTNSDGEVQLDAGPGNLVITVTPSADLTNEVVLLGAFDAPAATVPVYPRLISVAWDGKIFLDDPTALNVSETSTVILPKGPVASRIVPEATRGVLQWTNGEQWADLHVGFGFGSGVRFTNSSFNVDESQDPGFQEVRTVDVSAIDAHYCDVAAEGLWVVVYDPGPSFAPDGLDFHVTVDVRLRGLTGLRGDPCDGTHTPIEVPIPDVPADNSTVSPAGQPAVDPNRHRKICPTEEHLSRVDVIAVDVWEDRTLAGVELVAMPGLPIGRVSSFDMDPFFNKCAHLNTTNGAGIARFDLPSGPWSFGYAATLDDDYTLEIVDAVIMGQKEIQLDLFPTQITTVWKDDFIGVDPNGILITEVTNRNPFGDLGPKIVPRFDRFGPEGVLTWSHDTYGADLYLGLATGTSRFTGTAFNDDQGIDPGSYEEDSFGWLSTGFTPHRCDAAARGLTLVVFDPGAAVAPGVEGTGGIPFTWTLTADLVGPRDPFSAHECPG